MTSSRSQRDFVTEPGTVAKSFGLIVQCSIHHTLLSPWCAICFLAQVTQMCSLATWAVQGGREVFPLKVSPVWGPAGGAAFLVTQPQLPTETVHWVGLGGPTEHANPELPQRLGIEHLWVPRGNRWRWAVPDSASLSSKLHPSLHIHRPWQEGPRASAKPRAELWARTVLQRKNVLPNFFCLFYWCARYLGPPQFPEVTSLWEHMAEGRQTPFIG